MCEFLALIFVILAQRTLGLTKDRRDCSQAFIISVLNLDLHTLVEAAVYPKRTCLQKVDSSADIRGGLPRRS